MGTCPSPVGPLFEQALSSSAANRMANRLRLSGIRAESPCHLCVAGEQLNCSECHITPGERLIIGTRLDRVADLVGVPETVILEVLGHAAAQQEVVDRSAIGHLTDHGVAPAPDPARR